MDGCTASSDYGRQISEDVVPEASSPPRRFVQTLLAPHAKRARHVQPITIDATRDNDPLAPFRSAIMDTMGRGKSISEVRERVQFVPSTGGATLLELSRQPLDIRNHVSFSLYCYVVIREVESMSGAINTVAESGLDSSSSAENDLRLNVRNLERILRKLDDISLKHRYDKFTMASEESNGGTAGLTGGNTGSGRKLNDLGEDPFVLREAHRTVLWIARCKVVDILRNVARVRPPLDSVNEPLRVRAAAIGDEQLARWMVANNVCDRSMIVFDDAGQAVGHRLHECNLMAFWLTLKMVTTRWPYLALNEFVYKLIDELSRRVAFFVSYAERGENKTIDRSKRRVLGLALEMWQVRDIIPDAINKNKATDTRTQTSRVMLNMNTFIRRNGEYVHVNPRFVQETERIFAALERSIRVCSGFQWHASLFKSPASSLMSPMRARSSACLACSAIAATGERNVGLFEELCAEQMVGMFKEFVREAFHEKVYSFFIKPSDAERFRRINPADVSSARNIISREQRELHKLITKRFIEPTMKKIWESLAGDHTSPAYTLLAALASGYSVQQNANGARMTNYVVSLSELDPYLYNEERISRKRSVYENLHQQLETTGTLRFRNKLSRSEGMLAPAEEIYYEHPLIAHAFNSVMIVHDGHMHRCDLGFGQAFVVWLSIMCRDERLGGQLPNAALLHGLWARLDPASAREASELRAKTERRIARWDPVKTLLSCDKEKARTRRDMAQF